MPLTLHTASAPAFLQILASLDGLLDKAITFSAAKKVDSAVLAGSRLAPDMFPLSRQVQIACDFAAKTMARLGGQEVPSFQDTEKTLEELKGRIAIAVAAVNSVPVGQVAGMEDREITITVGGQSLTMAASRYLFQFALPNFYFHASAAYAILRHNGIEIGKRDFLGAF